MPAPQELQFVAPGAGATVPGVQLRHRSCRGRGWCSPTSHAVQNTVPFDGATYPGLHSLQLAESFLPAAVPGSQSMHRGAAGPLYLPAAQMVQSGASGPLARPLGQRMQAGEAWGLNLPDSQTKHSNAWA